MEKDRPLDGRKNNENNKDSQMGQVTPKKDIAIICYLATVSTARAHSAAATTTTAP